MAIPANPEALGPSLAHVVRIEKNKEIVLGQAWLAGQNCLITCGHVVEDFAANPGAIVVKFPSSGNRYAVKEIRLHPSFVRQPDQLVKFDAAVLTVALAYPESAARPLPFAFERPLKANHAIGTVRYPVHLGQLTAAPQPLAQEGRYLGQLRKHDSFHLLHDLALAPGDSGAPLFDGELVVALHCGDTATLPGLNLPTTSIRLALWIDALRDLGVSETAGAFVSGRLGPVWSAALIGLVTFTISVAAVLFASFTTTQRLWSVQQPVLKPVDLSFNKPLPTFTKEDLVEMVLTPRSDCWLYAFVVTDANQALQLFPIGNNTNFYVKQGQSRLIDEFGDVKLGVDNSRGKIHIVALNTDLRFVNTSDRNALAPGKWPLMISGDELTERIDQCQRTNPSDVLHLEIDAPRAREVTN